MVKRFPYHSITQRKENEMHFFTTLHKEYVLLYSLKIKKVTKTNLLILMNEGKSLFSYDDIYMNSMSCSRVETDEAFILLKIDEESI